VRGLNLIDPNHLPKLGRQIRNNLRINKMTTPEAQQQTENIAELLSAITDPQCQQKSLELLAGFKKSLELLKHSYLLLSEAEFYLEGAEALAHTQVRVKAVEPLQVDWDKMDAALQTYYQANVQSVARGVQVTRIFVVNRRDSLEQGLLKTLYRQSQDGIDVRLAYREDLPSDALIAEHSLDFAIYNDALVTDRSLDNGAYFGTKTSNPDEIDKYLQVFAVLEQQAQPLTPEIILSRWQLLDELPV
jgi:hypothetical protein